jgi:hypothetical protein
LFGRCETFYRVLNHPLAFLQHMHELDADQHTLGSRKRLEAQDGTGNPSNGSMVLLHQIIEIFDLADLDGSPMSLVVAPDGGRIGLAPINGNFVWGALSTY